MIFDSCMLTFEAANAGVGFAVANRAYIAPDILAGRLVAPFDVLHPNRNGRHLTQPVARQTSRNAALFATWIADQAEQSEGGLSSLRKRSGAARN